MLSTIGAESIFEITNKGRVGVPPAGFNVLQRSGQFLAGTENLTIQSVKEVVLNRVELDLVAYADDPRIVEKLEWIMRYASEKKMLLKPEMVNSSFSFMKA
jgi:hypothetical protein